MPDISSSLANVRVIKNLLPRHKRKSRPTLNDDIPFGRVHTDHMLVCDFLPQKGGWQTPEIMPYGPFELSPDAVVFHYGQQIFEGLKAYRSPQNAGEIYLFRPEMNAQRFYNSAVNLGMEPVPPALFVQCIKELIAVESDWVLPTPGALYIRPALIPLDQGVSYRASTSYRFFVIVSPSKNYYARETGVTVYVERHRVRAVKGGVGEAKCGGNYASALSSLAKAQSKGAEQVLWLDAFEHRYVEEVGAMNVMFVYKNKIITPELSGSILPGITRNSLLQLAKSLGFEIEEGRVNMDTILQDAKSGHLTEAFGCGTAAVISPIDAFVTDEGTTEVNKREVGPVALQLKKALLEMQTGHAPDPFGWRTKISINPT